MTDAQHIAEVTDYTGLIAAIRARKAELNLSDAQLEAASGLTAGHAGKLLGGAMVKSLGKVSLGLVLQGLGLKLIVAVDPAQAERMRPLYAERAVNQARLNNNASPVSTGMVSRVFRHFAKQGGRARWRGVAKKARSEAAREAALARWKIRRAKRAKRGSLKKAAGAATVLQRNGKAQRGRAQQAHERGKAEPDRP